LNEPYGLAIKLLTGGSLMNNGGFFYALHHQFNVDANTGLGG